MDKKFNSLTAISYIFDSMLILGAGFMPAAFNMSGCIFGFVMLFLVSIITAGSTYFSLTNEKTIKRDGLPSSVLDNTQEVKDLINSLIECMNVLCSYVLSFSFQKYFIDLVSVIVLDFWPNLHHTVVYYAVLFLSSICFFAVGLIENITVLSLFTMVNGIFVISLAFTLLYLNIFLPNFVAEVPKNLIQKTDYFFSLTCFMMSFLTRARLPALFTVIKDKRSTNIILISILSAFAGVLAYGLIGYLGYRLLGNSIGMGDLMQVFLDSNSTLNKYIKNSVETQSWDFFLLKYLTKYQGLCAIITILLGFPLTIAPIIRSCKDSTDVDINVPVMTQSKIMTGLIIFITFLNAIPGITLYNVFGFLGPSVINFVYFLLPAWFHLSYANYESKLKKNTSNNS